MAEDTETHASTPSKNFIQKKVGPFPLWAWVAIAAAAVGGYLILRGKSTSSGTAVAGTSAGTGVTSLDPLTGNQLMDQLSQFLTNQANTAASASSSAASVIPTTWTLRGKGQTYDPGQLAYDGGSAGVAGLLPLYTLDSSGIGHPSGTIPYSSIITQTGQLIANGNSYYIPIGNGMYVSGTDVIGTASGPGFGPPVAFSSTLNSGSNAANSLNG